MSYVTMNIIVDFKPIAFVSFSLAQFFSIFLWADRFPKIISYILIKYTAF